MSFVADPLSVIRKLSIWFPENALSGRRFNLRCAYSRSDTRIGNFFCLVPVSCPAQPRSERGYCLGLMFGLELAGVSQIISRVR